MKADCNSSTVPIHRIVAASRLRTKTRSPTLKFEAVCGCGTAFCSVGCVAAASFCSGAALCTVSAVLLICFSGAACCEFGGFSTDAMLQQRQIAHRNGVFIKKLHRTRWGHKTARLVPSVCVVA